MSSQPRTMFFFSANFAHRNFWPLFSRSLLVCVFVLCLFILFLERPELSKFLMRTCLQTASVFPDLQGVPLYSSLPLIGRIHRDHLEQTRREAGFVAPTFMFDQLLDLDQCGFVDGFLEMLCSPIANKIANTSLQCAYQASDRTL
jgi:hypothetical protein